MSLPPYFEFLNFINPGLLTGVIVNDAYVSVRLVNFLIIMYTTVLIFQVLEKQPFFSITNHRKNESPASLFVVA